MTWLDSRAKLTYNKDLDEGRQYGVALAGEGNDWVAVDWGLTLQMAVRFLKVLHASGSYDHRGYATS